MHWDCGNSQIDNIGSCLSRRLKSNLLILIILTIVFVYGNHHSCLKNTRPRLRPVHFKVMPKKVREQCIFMRCTVFKKIMEDDGGEQEGDGIQQHQLRPQHPNGKTKVRRVPHHATSKCTHSYKVSCSKDASTCRRRGWSECGQIVYNARFDEWNWIWQRSWQPIEKTDQRRPLRVLLRRNKMIKWWVELRWRSAHTKPRHWVVILVQEALRVPRFYAIFDDGETVCRMIFRGMV